MLRVIVLAAILLWANQAQAFNCRIRAEGCVFYIDYDEPTMLTDGSPLTDLVSTTVVVAIVGFPTNSVVIAASQSGGGGHIFTGYFVPMVSGQTVEIVDVHAFATSASLGDSDPSNSATLTMTKP